MKEFKAMFYRAFDYKGKSTVKEFWFAVLFTVLFAVLMICLALPFLADIQLFIPVASSLISLYEIVIFIPLLSLTIRRLHDAGKSGWWLLLSFFLFAGTIFLIYYLCQPSTARYNVWSEGKGEDRSVEDLKRELNEDSVNYYNENNNLNNRYENVADINSKNEHISDINSNNDNINDINSNNKSSNFANENYNQNIGAGDISNSTNTSEQNNLANFNKNSVETNSLESNKQVAEKSAVDDNKGMVNSQAKETTETVVKQPTKEVANSHVKTEISEEKTAKNIQQNVVNTKNIVETKNIEAKQESIRETEVLSPQEQARQRYINQKIAELNELKKNGTISDFAYNDMLNKILNDK